MFGKLINITLVTMTLVILPVTIFLFTHQETTSQQAETQYNCDINLDKKIDNTDYQALISCIHQDASCRGIRKLAADLNNDGTVDEKDLNYYLTKCQRDLKQ